MSARNPPAKPLRRDGRSAVRRHEVKRDMDLVREILLKVESDPALNGSHWEEFDTSDFPGHSLEEIAYHIDLLLEAKLVEGDSTLDSGVPAISRLTWEGHEFIGSTSDPDIWAKVKERTKGFPDVAISVMWELAKAELKKKLGL
jgi:hypothetical protein